MDNLTLEIKDAIWEIKNSEKPIITVKAIYDQANGKIPFSKLPEIRQYLDSVKHKFLVTTVKGYLELHPIGNATIKDLISKA